jgi:nucleotide-binding universal stress UspA family protein
MRVLLAVDGSAPSTSAVELAQGIAWPPGSTIRVVSVDDPHIEPLLGMPGLAIAPETVDRLVAASRDEATRVVGEAAARLEGQDRTVETAVLDGRPANGILDAERDFRPDLVVLGSHGRGAVGSALLGSVSIEVVEHAGCSVLVARGSALRRILFADDGSAGAATARSLLEHMPGFAGLPVHVVCVSEQSPAWYGWLEPAAPDDVDAFERAITADEERHAAMAVATAAQLSAAGLKGTGEARVGDPANEITDLAKATGADLIVLGTRGRTGVQGLLLGSVARKVLHHAPCSVLVVRSRSTGRP